MEWNTGTASVAELLLKYLAAEDVQYIFGVPGAAITPIHEALSYQAGIKHILAKHEEGAAFMAGTYARVRGKLGVCCTTTGPGGTNALTGIAAAYQDSVPVLLLTGQVPTRAFGRGSLQDSSSFGVDLVQIYKPVTKLSAMLPSPERMPDLIRRALRAALSGRPGPVHLSLPVDMLKQDIAMDAWQMSHYRATSTVVDRAAIAEAAKLLISAKRPCILAGHGVNLAGVWGELLRLAEMLQIPVVTTPKAKGAFPEDHTLSLGVFGFGGHRQADVYLLSTSADVLLVLGSSLGELSTHTWNKRLQPTKALIQIDIDPYELGKNYPVDVGVIGDLRAALPELTDAVARLLEGEARGNDSLRRFRAEVPRMAQMPAEDRTATPIKPQRLVREMQGVLPEDTLLFIDSGNCVSWSVHYYETRIPNTYFVNMGLASMGHATAGAIGGKLAAPDSTVVALVGDAAFAMNGMEIHTAVELGLRIIWVVLNDQGHGMVYHGERLLLGEDLQACHFRVPLDVAGLAAAMGARSFRARTLNEFSEALSQALAHDGPCVIDAAVDREEVPHALAERVRTVAASVDNAALSMRNPTPHRS
ncbi:MAG: thiamine pyrophosphate-binding protein [Polyangiaceae bacterium]|nr:thiamine pyrophosphate-binding protein [Polyangiaceae bacterium]